MAQKLPSPNGQQLASPLIKTPSPSLKLERDRVGNPVINIVRPTVNVNSGSSRNPDTPEDIPTEGSGLDEKLDTREEAEQEELLKGDLPCLDSKPECITQLQALAIANSPEIRAIDTQIANSADAVKLARIQGQGSFVESIQPYVSAIAPILLQDSRPLSPNENRFSLTSRLLFEALPTIISGQATNAANQTRNNQANADLTIKLAQLEKTKVEVTIAIKGKVLDEVIEFERIKDESNLQSTIVKRETARAKLIEISYRMGESSTIDQIARLNEFDRKKIIAAQLKTKLRSQALRIQRLVKGASEG